MSDTKKREPMLSDRAVRDLASSDRGIRLARDFYEDLITKGKLRVVEEVEIIRADNGWDACSKCGEQPNAHSPVASWTFCPGCGQPIKR